ncbi:hypothetical protein GN958_ATG14953 [Phytophthora infestans]|uniref:Uncharacterized protein n=1 Tax=Phytophthora infestans TaxID=4787 RepID=A0A8S9U4K9_PHYIN|nr:hypothetical protein GN958_ATG14953 [Phytophthora infestans]
MSPAKRTGQSSGKVPSTTPPASPSSMSPTDLRVLAQALSDQVQTLTAELQTAQDAQDQAASLHTTQLQTLRAQIHDQAMEIQGWEHRAASRSQDLRLLLADQAVEIRDLTGRLDRASRQRDVMRDDNDHLLREMALAGSEIHQLQSRIHDLERDLEDSQTARAAADVSLDRLRDELRLTQEEVVTNDYVGSAHDGSALGSARGGSPAPNPPPSSPDVALAQLSEELQDTKESLERASAGRDYALEEFVRMTRLRDEIQTQLADSELQRDKATTEWADAERALTELESKLRRMSDKLKKADATTAKLQDQLSAAQTQQQQLILERDRGLSERDLARRRLALVTAAVSDPLPPLSGPSQAASVSAPLPTVSGADSSTAKRPRSTSPAPSTGSSRPHKQARASPKAKPKTAPVSKSAPQAGSTSLSKAGSTPAPKTSVSPSKSGAGSKSGSTARSKSTSASKTGPVATSKTGSTVSKPGSTSKTGSTAAASKSGSGPKTGSTASKAGSVAPSKTGSAVSKSGSTAKTGSTAVSKSGSASTTGSTAGPSVTTPIVPQSASTNPPPARTGPGKGKAKRVIPPGCGLGSSEDDEDEDSDWSDGSGPPNRSSSKRTPSAGPYPFTLSDEDDDDDDDDDESPEDSEEAQAAEDALEEDTRRALSQSRSEARRRSLSTPPPQVAGTAGSGGATAGSAIHVDSDGGSGSDGGGGSPRGGGLLGSGGGGAPGGGSSGSGGGGSPHGGGSPGSPHGGGSPGSPRGGGSPGSPHGGGSPGSVLIPAPPNSSLPGMLPAAPFGPDAAFIPGRRAPVAFAARDIEPWSAKKLNRVAIISMKITVLFPELPFRAEWIFPRTADAIPRAGYVDSLITRPLVEELTSAAPWDTLVTTPVDPVSFRGDVRGRLGVFVRAFRDFASKHRVAIWEGTHRFPISRNQLQGSTWLSNFNKQRGNRRSHAGRAWKRVLVILVLAIQDGWCDVDILLDPSFLHLPRRGDKVAWFPGSVSRQANLEDPNLHRPEPTSLLEALREIDEAEPWRIQFRGDLSQHPGRQIQRLVSKFFNVQPKTT